MKVLVTGGTGAIGARFVEILGPKTDLTYTYSSEKMDLASGKPVQIDITKKEQITKIVGKTNPDVVVHCAALADFKKCESDKASAKAINTIGTRNVCEACKKSGAKMIFISTSAVFDGSKNPYSEGDDTSPINYYGVTKVEAESHMREILDDGLVLRTNQNYCWTKEWQDKNLVIRTLGFLEKGEDVYDVEDWYDTPTFTDNLVEIAMDLADSGKSGTYHVVGSEFINRYDWTKRVAKAFGFDLEKVKPMRSTDLKVSFKRSSVQMSNKKVKRDSRVPIVELGEGLKMMFKQRPRLQI